MFFNLNKNFTDNLCSMFLTKPQY